MKSAILKAILYSLPQVIKVSARTSKEIRAHLDAVSGIVQLSLKDGSVAQYYEFTAGRISSHSGVHPEPDVRILFKTPGVALKFLQLNPDQGEIVHFLKNFQVELIGDDKLAYWFATLSKKLISSRWRMGTPMKDGTTRYTANSNGGPLFVYVKDGRIIRTTPITFSDEDPAAWEITARGRTFRPIRQSLVNVHALATKSLVYSDKRLLYPMKRVDFDPNGARNPQNRGVSGYERISWEEALAIVVGEIKRQKLKYGPGSMAVIQSPHHMMGNIGYWLSALYRFCNLIGASPMMMSPISWEGWYWGAQHHYGNSLRLGSTGSYGTVEDCLKECEMIVFWSSDPESTSGVYAGHEGTQRRLWAKELGIEFVHIDPHYNQTAQLLGGKWLPVKPTTDSALAHAIMYVWITESLYDADYVARNTTGFDEWRAYILGESDGTPKTPAWQESETGIPARDVYSLARAWGRKKTYLSAGGVGGGFGGACRASSGQQWARNMILLMTMQGWGKPGVNFGNLQYGTPLDLSIYFPGYAEGGISGDVDRTAAALNNYQRMPQVISKSIIKQIVPQERMSEGITEGHCEMYPWDGSSLEAQFQKFGYPAPGYSPVHMIYRYGASFFGTTMNSSRLIDMYRHDSLDFVVCQSIWNEGEAKFADLVLPACTNLERYDISEAAGCAGYIHHNQNQLNHRIVLMQHKCIEPLGESKSDFQIFLDILTGFGLGTVFAEGCDELNWCKRIFQSSDIKDYISWTKFLQKGYVVLPPEKPETRDPVYMRWFVEGRKKDVPEPHPLPADYTEYFQSGLQTQSGKIEFLPSSLKRFDPDNDERPVLNRYITSWEGLHTAELVDKYPLQLLTTHPRYSFHTQADGKNSFINAIEDHRIEVDGYRYWVLRMNPQDAKARGIAHHDLVQVFNDRATVICAVDVCKVIAPGVVKAFESCAEFDFIEREDGKIIDRGGCMNLLTPSRNQAKGTSAIAPNSCLVQVQAWNEVWEKLANG